MERDEISIYDAGDRSVGIERLMILERSGCQNPYRSGKVQTKITGFGFRVYGSRNRL